MSKILDEILNSNVVTINLKRRKLLPTWIKVFVWLFMIFGVVNFFILILASVNIISLIDLSLYGIQASKPFTTLWILILSLFLLKGIVAFGLWVGIKWGVNLAIVDAIVGVFICLFVLIYPFLDNDPINNITLRLELVVLIPYLLWLFRIRKIW